MGAIGHRAPTAAILIATAVLAVSSCRSVECHDKTPGLCTIRCSLGSMKACAVLGWMHESGRGVEKDIAKAKAHYKGACQKDETWGCTNLGWLYRNGKGGKQDDQRAIDLFKRGCEGEDVRGCAGLGEMYEYGRGVARNLEQATKFYGQACDGDFGPA